MLQKTLANILADAAQRSDRAPTAKLLEDAWPALVGREIARLTRPSEFEDERVGVVVASEEWKRELEHRSQTILRRIDSALPWRVAEITFEVGDVPRTPEQPAQDATRQVSDDPVDEPTEAALEDLDPRLKTTLRRIRRHMLREQGENASDEP